ncbi:hypothetical protein [Sporosarcina sp. JAI121]|uniref:hypothetical protein n=1 Tax=Sporosarcina sp. JAI121 TaxID=2723064 RepID=UPI0015C743E2|nr:hypothetical protein [Sporosarcina sp. JAI121]NYF26468.1 hypothetical protein [Sporosarcina sp. JAI121]
MKKLISLFLVAGVLTLAACSTSSQKDSFEADLTSTEVENVEAAKADLSLVEFEEAIEEVNQETAKVSNAEMVNLFEGASYKAYLFTRAKLSKESFKKAQEQNIFTTDINYDDYKNISDPLLELDKYQEWVKDDEAGNYGAYVAKSVQYITPEGNPE